MNKYAIHTSQAPEAIGPYSQAIRVGNFLYTSGQIALDPATGKFLSSSIKEETSLVLKNLVAILKADGMDLANVVKTNVFIIDIEDFSSMNEIYESFFGEYKPARSCVQVAALPKGAQVEIDAVAFSK